MVDVECSSLQQLRFYEQVALEHLIYVVLSERLINTPFITFEDALMKEILTIAV